jgi:hypothetical protein
MAIKHTFVTLLGRLPVVAIPEENDEPSATTFRIFRDKYEGKDNLQLEGLLEPDQKNDIDYLGSVILSQPGSRSLYINDGKQELTSQEVKELARKLRLTAY